MIDRDFADRPGCPRCRQTLVRRLHGERHITTDFPAPLPVRHYGPDFIAYAALAAALVGTAVSAYGGYASSQQQSANLQYNAILARQQAAYQQQMAEFQAQLIARQATGAQTLADAQAAIQEQQAIAADAAGRVRAAAIRRQYDRTQSEVRAAIGKSGVDSTGSPLMVLLENADTVGQELALNEYQTALDVAGAKAGAAYSRTEGQLRAGSLMGEAAFARFGGQSAAAASLAQANMFGYQAGGVRTAGFLGAGTTLLHGARDAAPFFLRYGQATPRGGYNTGAPAWG
jgi:hypothetical protein